MSALMLQSSLKLGGDSPLSSFGYSLLETLAGGHYGIIHKAKCQVSRQTVIVKELDCSTQNLSRSSAREALIMRELNHQHVVSLHFDIKLGNRLFLVMQHAQGGDLHEHITSSPDGHLSVSEAKRMFAQVIAGLEHMHSRNIVHGDIKPDNIFLDQDNNVLIGDMGLSGMFKPKSKSYNATGGTVHYSAPETFYENSMVNGPELDIWSAGVLLYVMLRGRYPFWAENDQDLALAISTCEPYWPEWFPAEAIDLISQMTQKKPSKRISLSKIKKHPFLRDEYRKLSRKLRRTSSSCV